jgi:23S rRNA pseudouridine955/2504/2580 synthase
MTMKTKSNPNLSAAEIAFVRSLVIHEDEHVLALNKPSGLSSQGGRGQVHTLDELLFAFAKSSGARPRLVHRLDRDTSGVLVLARSAAVAAKLGKAFRDKTTHKIYWAAVAGLPKPRRGRIDQPLAKLPGPAGERVAPDEEDGKRAVTWYRTIAHAGDKLAWLALQPITGRTHQLRAHCVTLGTPILGDGKYGGAAAHPAGVPNARALHLHARALALPHPRGGRLVVTAPLPTHMRETWAFFGFDEGDEPDPFAELAPER